MRLLIAIALVFSITPGMAEVGEAIGHLVAHGDLPHHENESHDDGCAEHTCTPLAHHCGCHTTMSAQTTASSPATTTSNITRVKLPSIEIGVDRVCEPPPVRPPIA